MSSMSPRRIEAAMASAMKLKEDIGYDDAKLLIDSIEGETDVFAIIDKLAEQALADKLLVERGKERIQRLEGRADRIRSTIRNMMEALEINNIERPVATLSLGAGPRAVVITDQAVIEPAYWRRSIDRVELAKALKAGREVAGATLANGPSVLTIRSR